MSVIIRRLNTIVNCSQFGNTPKIHTPTVLVLLMVQN